MDISNFRLFNLIHFLFTFFICQAVSVQELYLDNYRCSGQVYTVTDRRYYEVVWGGEYIASHCRLTFMGGARLDGDQEGSQVCAETNQYRVAYCQFSVAYFSGSNPRPVTKTSCGHGPPRYCVDQGDQLKIHFNFSSISKPSVDSNVVRLLIFTQKYDKHVSNRFDVIVACVIGGVILAVVFSLVLAIVHFRHDDRGKHRPVPPYALKPDPDRETRV